MRNIEAFHVLQTVFVKVCIPPIAIWAGFGAITSSSGVGKGRGGGTAPFGKKLWIYWPDASL